MEASEERIRDVTSIQLAHRQQVECGRKKSKPRGNTDRMKIDDPFPVVAFSRGAIR